MVTYFVTKYQSTKTKLIEDWCRELADMFFWVFKTFNGLLLLLFLIWLIFSMTGKVFNRLFEIFKKCCVHLKVVCVSIYKVSLCYTVPRLLGFCLFSIIYYSLIVFIIKLNWTKQKNYCSVLLLLHIIIIIIITHCISFP